MKKVIIDQDKCIGCTTCTIIAPKDFKMVKNGKANVINSNPKNLSDVKKAIKSCPTRAISMTVFKSTTGSACG